MNKYLVTGAAGFIGSSIARALVARGDSVRGVDNFSTGNRKNLQGLESIDFIEGDLSVPGVAEAACQGVTCVFHQAALPSVARSVEDPLRSNSNVDATLHLLVAARQANVKRVVYAGSSSCYGESLTLPKVETMLPAPISPYAVTKLTGEYYMQAFARVYGLETVTLRYFNVFGPHQDPSSEYSGVLARFTIQMLAGQVPVIYGDGEQSRDFTYIDNVVSGNLLAMAAPAANVSGHVFNVATASRITLNQAVIVLRNLCAYTGDVRYAETRRGDVKHSLADIAKAQLAFGYTPLVDFAEGLRRTVEWYRKGVLPPA